MRVSTRCLDASASAGHNVAMTELTELILRPMTASEYHSFHSKLIAEYARVNVEEGNWLQEESMELSKNGLEELLPNGVETPRTLLLAAENSGGEYVGYVWIGLDRPGTTTPSAWIYDIEVSLDQRGKGYGRLLLQAAEKETVRNGVTTLGLNVFGSNIVARTLYETSGYSVAQVRMSKKLST